MIEFLKGKKTYIMVVLGFLYGGGVQIGLWGHYPLMDAALAGGTVAALRAGIAKDAAKLILIGWLTLGLTSCAQGPVHTGSAAATVATDVETAAATALQAYADYKAGNVDFVWSLSKGANAYAQFVQDSGDIKALVKAWTGNTGDSQKLADKLARIFASSTAPPEQKANAIAQAAVAVASNTSP